MFLVRLNVFESKQRCMWVGQITTVNTCSFPAVPAPPFTHTHTHTHSYRYYHIVFKGEEEEAVTMDGSWSIVVTLWLVDRFIKLHQHIRVLTGSRTSLMEE